MGDCWFWQIGAIFHRVTREIPNGSRIRWMLLVALPLVYLVGSRLGRVGRGAGIVRGQRLDWDDVCRVLVRFRVGFDDRLRCRGFRQGR